ncbi:MAG TPA: GTP 3',8-cyclase MoaA [Candidatus Poseidoniales archaeon]|nr:MAG: GTP 3',8-cyclase MoaA [Euryarchaeota archaeon]HIF45940.1 GTP 3',8-cyclase MoaA [Candidatus Poseidoniales archaeon]HIL65576.1 GTP 3',8-cyclase MoaA [Candidatus Poseidoniales archaeon]
MVKDKRGRPLRDLRISLTDRCNMRCSYCMPREHFPADHPFLPKSEILSYEELASLIHAMIPLGLEKVRLTGGEPLLRRDLCEFIKLIPSELDIAMTTNGLLLGKFAEELKLAGLKRVTVSLDAIDIETFQVMSDTKANPETVLRGIESARLAGLKVKVNTVIRAGYNEHSIKAIPERFLGTDVIVRFIEFMDVGETNSWNLQEVVTGDQMRSMFDHLKSLEANNIGEVANRYKFGNQEIGFIESVSKPFCNDCSRARISADGALHTCLFSSDGHDLKAILRMGASKDDLSKAISTIWNGRSDAYSEQRGSVEHTKVEMSYIGG